MEMLSKHTRKMKFVVYPDVMRVEEKGQKINAMRESIEIQNLGFCEILELLLL